VPELEKMKPGKFISKVEPLITTELLQEKPKEFGMHKKNKEEMKKMQY